LVLRFLESFCSVPICADLPEAAGARAWKHNVEEAVPPIATCNLEAKSPDPGLMYQVAKIADKPLGCTIGRQRQAAILC
jgi:hypothetical protein